MIKSMSISDHHASAVDSNGRLFCWGTGNNGELGIETQTLAISAPTLVTK